MEGVKYNYEMYTLYLYAGKDILSNQAQNKKNLIII